VRWTEFASREARLTLQEWQKRTGDVTFPIPVEDIADLYYRVSIDLSHTLPARTAGRLYADQRVMEIRRDDPEPRQRFTIAHEIGHYRLHVLIEKLLPNGYGCDETILDLQDQEVTELLPGFPSPLPEPHAPLSANIARRIEIEANAYAAELLMPATMVEQAIAEFGLDVQMLAINFAVSQQAMQYRLEKLLFLPPSGPQTTFL
jgi:DNA helicase-2/ATP-dependent DNA helicase PcrA